MAGGSSGVGRGLRAAIVALVFSVPFVLMTMVSLVEAAKDDTSLVSVAKVVPGGKVNANVDPTSISLSSDGRYVAFSTSANNLDANDTNADDDIYVRDTLLGTNTLVSPGDGPGDAQGYTPSISDDGQTVAFATDGDIDPDDSNNEDDVYVADMSTSTPTLELVSRPTGTGNAAPATTLGTDFAPRPQISGDGTVVAFVSRDNTLDPLNNEDTLTDGFNSLDVFVRDLDTDSTELVSRGAEDGNQASYRPSIDTDGSHVSFDTQATNLDPADLDLERDVYVRDRSAATLTLASRADGPAGDKGEVVLPAPGTYRATDSTLSGDGDVVSFVSYANNLDPADTDSADDVYIRDIGSNDTELISRADGAGDTANNSAAGASISADGARIAFFSSADNLDPAMSTPGSTRFAYIRDLNSNTTKLHSRADGISGEIANAGVDSVIISSGGIAIGFASESTNLDPGDTDAIIDAYVRNTGSGETVLASLSPTGAPLNANGPSGDPSISADGRYIAFTSSATNIDPAAINSSSDIFVLDTQTGDIELASRENGAAGDEGDGGSGLPAISADGRFVAFESDAENLAGSDDGDGDIFVRDLENDTVSLVSLDSDDLNVGGSPTDPSISGDGSRVAFSAGDPYHPDDVDIHRDIYVRDLDTDTTLIASRPDGAGNLTGSDESELPEISRDGSSVAFESEADNLTGPTTIQQIVVRNIDQNTTTVASRADGAAGAIGSQDSRRASISSDGSVVAFHTNSDNLDPDDLTTNSSIFVRNLNSVETTLASRASDGTPAIGNASNAVLSGDGTYVVFRSAANNLDPASSDALADLYQRDLLAGTTVMASRATGAGGAEGNGTDDDAAVSQYGRFVAFESSSTNLDPADDDSQLDVYLREVLAADATPPVSMITGGPAEGSFIPETAVEMTFTVNENFAVSECRFDAGAFVACSGSVLSGQLAEGPHTFEVRSTDRVDNLEAPAVSRSFTLDTTEPDTAINSGPSGTVSNKTPTMSFSSPEPGASFECSLDGAVFSACTSPLELGPLSQGKHDFEVRAVDQAGNTDVSPASRSFTVDTIITGRGLKVAKNRKVGKKVKVPVTVKTGEKATVTVTGKVTLGGGALKKITRKPASGKKVKLNAVLKKSSRNSKVKAKIRKGKKPKMKLTIKVSDGFGNVRKTKKTVRLTA